MVKNVVLKIPPAVLHPNYIGNSLPFPKTKGKKKKKKKKKKKLHLLLNTDCR